MKAVILAGGSGIRMRPLTEDIPKAMLKIGSKPLLQRILENLQEARIKEVLLVVGYKKHVIEDFFKEDFNGMKLSYFVQKQPLGTAHALSLVEGFVQGNFLVVNGDVLVRGSVFVEISEVDELNPIDTVIVVREVKDPWRYGCISMDGEKVKDIVEKPPLGQEPSNMVNTGVYRFSQNIFDAIKKTDLSEREEFELVDSIKIQIKNGKTVGVKKCSEPCIDIGNEEDLKLAQEMFKD